jgi:hypothetical protein
VTEHFKAFKCEMEKNVKKQEQWEASGFERVYDTQGKLKAAKCLICLKEFQNIALSRRNNHR